ncbi:MAG: Pyridoxamine 5-phosphate oxidase-related, FMN-binding protein [Acidobacteriales bacterium]|nr:Pyridoxamine 5-phosphate oxidase-related, FMN-binding protein [Terriglobales bacterium]
MVEIVQMSNEEMESLLSRVGFGHLGCSRHGCPYVIPIHYVYAKPDVYIFTTRGMKTEFIETNPEVCLQVEEVQNETFWSSVIFTGRAELLVDAEEKKTAWGFIQLVKPSLTPAIAHTWFGPLQRSNTVGIYRIGYQTISGRKTRSING